jgi:hypothetical protein
MTSAIQLRPKTAFRRGNAHLIIKTDAIFDLGQQIGLRMPRLGERGARRNHRREFCLNVARLGVFALVNLSLLRLRYRGVKSKTPRVTIPVLVPAAGFATCVAMIAFAFLK